MIANVHGQAAEGQQDPSPAGPAGQRRCQRESGVTGAGSDETPCPREFVPCGGADGKGGRNVRVVLDREAAGGAQPG
jgi:hypothetical protein